MFLSFGFLYCQHVLLFVLIKRSGFLKHSSYEIQTLYTQKLSKAFPAFHELQISLVTDTMEINLIRNGGKTSIAEWLDPYIFSPQLIHCLLICLISVSIKLISKKIKISSPPCSYISVYHNQNLIVVTQCVMKL